MALKRESGQRGFTLVELMVVVAIIVIIAVVAVPNAVNSIRMLKLNGAVGDYANMLQQARLRAVRDNRTYQVHIAATGTLAPPNDTIQLIYVDAYPQNNDGSSGNGAYDNAVAAQTDPSIALTPEVVLANANPQLASLQNALGNKATIDPAGNDPTFGPRGTPCTPTFTGGAAYCVQPGQPDQFIEIFQSTTNQRIEGVTVDGAGRIQRWLYNTTGNSWSTL